MKDSVSSPPSSAPAPVAAPSPTAAAAPAVVDAAIGALIVTEKDAVKAVKASAGRLLMLMRASIELRSLSALGCARAWLAMAADESELRSFLLTTAHTLSILYARKAVTAFFAAYPHIPCPAAPLSVPLLGLDLRQPHSLFSSRAAPVTDAVAGVKGASSSSELGSDAAATPTDAAAAGSMEVEPEDCTESAAAKPKEEEVCVADKTADVPAYDAATNSDKAPVTVTAAAAATAVEPDVFGLDPSSSWQRTYAARVFDVVKLMCWKGISLPEHEADALSAAPWVRRAARLTARAKRALSSTSVNSSSIGSSVKVLEDEMRRILNPLSPNAAGVWRFEPANGSLITHPLGLLEPGVRALLINDVRASSVPSSSALTSVTPSPSAAAAMADAEAQGAPSLPPNAHPVACISALNLVAEEVEVASDRAYLSVGWRGQYLLESTTASSMPSGQTYLNLDGVPCIPAELTGTLPDPRWSDRDSMEVPCPDMAVWLSGLLMEAVCEARRCASYGPSAGDSEPAFTAQTVCNVPLALAELLAPFGAGTAPSSGPPSGSSCSALALPLSLQSKLAAERAKAANAAPAQLALSVHLPPSSSALSSSSPSRSNSNSSSTAASASSAATAAVVIVPGGGRMQHDVAVALCNAWAVGMRCAHAGVKERAARTIAGVVWEAVADVRLAQEALGALAG